MAFKERALDLINAARAAKGIAPLQVSSALASIAQDRDFTGCGGGRVVHGRATDMGERNYFDHAIKDCTGQSVFHMLVAAGITHSGAAENIGFMNATDDELIAAENIHGQLMASSGHLGNIMNPAFTHVGIGLFRSFNQAWTGAPGPPPNMPLIRAFVTSQVFATNPSRATSSMTGGATYHPLTPSRLVDTRFGVKLGGAATMNLKVTGVGGVPSSGVGAVVLNVTVTDPTAALSFLTVFPKGEPQPVAANLNFTAGLTVGNLVVVKAGAGGEVSVFNQVGSTHVIVDVGGWFDLGDITATGSRFHPVTPSRIADSRTGLNASGPLGPGATMNVPVLNRGGVPVTGVAAVVANVTAVGPTSSGFLTVFAAGEAAPPTSNLNFATGQTVANLVVTKVGAGGAIAISNFSGTTQVVVDVAGWFDQGTLATGSGFHPLSPSRILDTRLGVGAPTGPLGPGATLSLQVSGAGGVPTTGVDAVVLNVAVTGPTAQSFLTAFPVGEARPDASNLCFVAGQTVPNLVVCKLGGGRISLVNNAGSTHVIADVAGWFDLG